MARSGRGKAQHQAFWDGEKWTGETASSTGQGTPPKKSNVGRIVLIVVLAIIGLPILALIVVSIAGSEVSQTFTDIEEGLGGTTPPATSPPGGFAPFTMSGSGDDFVNFSTPGDQPAALSITHNGSSNFSVTSFSGSNDYIDFLVNEIGSYRDTVATNFLIGEEVGALEISAGGPWTIRAVYVGDLPLRSGSARGTGDDVIRINISNAAVDLTHNGDSNFAVWIWSGTGRDLAVNEVGSYSGTIRSGGEFITVSVKSLGGEQEVRGHRAANQWRLDTYPDGWKG